MEEYSFKELADMHYCYGFADGQSQEAAQIYAEKFPDRKHPDHTVFEKIDIQLRERGDFSQEDKELDDNMSDSEVKRKGRPKKKESEVSDGKSASKRLISNGDDSAPPVKRGRGRPPKGGSAAAQKKSSAPSSGRGRGRPPKNAAKKAAAAAKKEESEEEDDAVEDEKKDSSCEAEDSS